MVLVAERTELGQALEGWRQQQRVEWTHVSRVSGVSRNTIYNAMDGGTPGTDTLRKIARGLATDPYTGDLNRIAYEAIIIDLFKKAGHGQPAEVGTILNFDDELLKRLQEKATASEMAELIDRWPGLSELQREAVRAAVRAALED